MKHLELIMGEVVCDYEMLADFRYCPITVMNNDILLDYLLSSDACMQQ